MASLRRSPRVEKSVGGGPGLRLKQVLAAKNDASLDLRQADVEGKGRGVLTTRRFLKGEPVVEYKGTLLAYSEAKVSK